MRSGLLLTILLPLGMWADTASPPSPLPTPPGVTITAGNTGSTSTAIWVAGYAQSTGDYYLYLEPYSGTITGFTAQFAFSTASPDNGADFGVVLDFGGSSHGTPEDPNNPNIITWDASHQVETITVPIAQPNVTQQIASVTLPAGVTAPPQIAFLDITTGQLQSVPEPAAIWLVGIGISGIAVLRRIR